MKVQQTTNYKQFKTILGNRLISKNHVTNLTKSIAKHNLLEYEPILVNERMEIIDGQHRFLVCKNNKFPVYYLVLEGGSLEDVQLLNSTATKWNGKDYMNSYAQLGLESYRFIKDMVDTYTLNVSNVVELCVKHPSGSIWQQFKRGLIVIDNQTEAENSIVSYSKFKPFCEKSVFSDRDFVRAVKKIMETTPIETILSKMTVYGGKIEYHEKVRDYLREFEEILNYRMRKNVTRLF